MSSIPNPISREEIAQLPVRRYEGPVCLVATPHDLERAAHEIHREPVIGFDTETPPTFRKGQSHRPTLVQIATSRTVYLFQLRQMDFAPVLTSVLNDADIVKAGVALDHDLRQLQALFPFEPRGVLDLGEVARKRGMQQSGVRNLAGILLGFRITKGSRTSNWGRPVLSPSQITYAATDAWACRELYLRFEQLGWLAG